jgi:hypothetical protein
LRVLAFVSPVASFAVSIAFVVGSGSKLPTDNPIFSSYFGLFVIAVLAVVVFARVITTLARMPSDIKAEDEAAVMARFAASTARTVNKFLDSIPSSRGLTSLQGFAVWCIQARGWDLSDKAPALLEARWLRKSFVMAWARPLFEAFAAGCWKTLCTGMQSPLFIAIGQDGFMMIVTLRSKTRSRNCISGMACGCRPSSC